MANSGGGVGAKFVSVNLNKSYGQPSYHHSHSSYNGSYGQSAAGSRVRSGSGVVGGGGGGGMVVLSRSRGIQKAGPKLSVPPPLNLPSLRKEHERFDVSGSGGALAGAAGSATGSRPTSSGIGWTKSAALTLQEKQGNDGVVGRAGGEIALDDGMNQIDRAIDGVLRGSNAYVPPSVRPGGLGLSVPGSASAHPMPAEKSPVLRGEDFPSLKAALPTSSGPAPRQKDNLHQKQKQAAGEESNEQRGNYHTGPLVHVQPQELPSHGAVNDGSDTNGGQSHSLSSSWRGDKAQKKEEFFPGPLPLVRFNPRSDWADDERDTGQGFTDRGRDHRFPKNETHWDADFDMPRTSILPKKPAHNVLDRRAQRDEETGKDSSSEVPRVDPYRRDLRTPSREGREVNTWRTSPLPKDGFTGQDAGNDRNVPGARLTGFNQDMGKENKYILPAAADNTRDIGMSGNRGSSFGRREPGHVSEGRQQWNQVTESFSSHVAERNARDRYSNEHTSRFRGNVFQGNMATKPSFSSGGKGFSTNDPILNIGREKRFFSKSERNFVEDPFLKNFDSAGFDEQDPFSGGLVGIIKRKKDAAKQADFHDPVRESFEAELERVQQMQEMERQRIIEEQERAFEQARREEEERQRLMRDKEERRRRMEEEAREAAWRAEQERLEAIQRAEEQKIAREEEKRRILMEEERRKQAAKQKLLELEARIARRQAEGTIGENCAAVVEEHVSTVNGEQDLDGWEDSERMVERITTSASSESPMISRPFDMGSSSQPSREGSSGYLERGKPMNSWRRDVFENENGSSLWLQDQEIGHYTPRRDGGRLPFPRKEFYGVGYMSSRTYSKGAMQEPPIEEFAYLKEQRWNPSTDGDPYSKHRKIESEFHDNLAERYGGVGWGQARAHGSPRSPYLDRLCPNSDADELYSYGRSRYSMRQPRVLPPPAVTTMNRTSFRVENERTGPSSFLDGDLNYSHSTSETTIQAGFYGHRPEQLEQSELVDVQQENAVGEEEKMDEDTAPRCESQSSLSVSSPPNSPPHLSHDELDDNGDSPVIATTLDGRKVSLSRNECNILNVKSGNDSMMTASASVPAGVDEKWALGNDELQEQEEYDEDEDDDEDGYQEEDEVHEGDDENIDLAQEFEDLHLEEKGSLHMMDNLVLGFDEGVEVRIPSDDFERDPSNEESKCEVPVGALEEQATLNVLQGDRRNLMPVDDSSLKVGENEKAVQDLVVQPIITPQVSKASDRLDNLEHSVTSDVQHTPPSSVDMPSHALTGQTTMPTVSAPSQADLPVKLQFGLFSGPSLIPSPVPAIQIGSIQMPLHLHPPVGPSLAPMHASQPPLFQFGQVRYTSPISQGILPITPQSLSFVQPNVQADYSLNQSSGGSLLVQPGQDTTKQNIMKDDVPSCSVKNHSGLVSRKVDLSHENMPRGLNSYPPSAESNAITSKAPIEVCPAGQDLSETLPQAEDRQKKTILKNYMPSSKVRGSEGQLPTAPTSSQHDSSEKDSSNLKAQGLLSGSKGKKFSHSAKNSGLRSSFPGTEASRNASGFQRRPRWTIHQTEFRVRETADRRQPSGLVSSNNLELHDKSNSNGRGVGTLNRSGSKRSAMSNKPFKQIVESENSGLIQVGSQKVDSGSTRKVIGKESLTKGPSTSHSGEGILKRNISDEDVDTPLQSGIVRVFKQPGIEAPSDEDDFIEVRSKRQMLNDRREQREKQIKAKSRVNKLPRKPRPGTQSTVTSTSSKKTSSTLGGEGLNNIQSDFIVSEGRGLVQKEVSSGFAAVLSQPLAPIGTPAVNTDAQADSRTHAAKSLQTSSDSVVPGSSEDLGSCLIFETANKVLDSVQTSLGCWGNRNTRINQQVMTLTQTQLEEAMKPARFDTHVTSIAGHTSTVSEPVLPSTSILAKDKLYSPAASPINSLLAGEKIQFGAVTSTTVLPPSSRTVLNGIGVPASCLSDIQISHNLAGAENDCDLFFRKDKHSNESCVHLEVCEAEAEAAASAVAVAAIGTDEIVGNGLGSVSDTKGFGGSDIDGITGGMAGDQQLASQSRSEESLSVSLPADLSVETPPISLWPPLPSPQNSSSHMLSHFPRGPPTHFPFYDMNPMLGGPIFAFGPHEDSAGSQSQSQQSSPVSGPVGSWQPCHSTVDSFYGPPAGFTGPFINPPGGIPAVQAPPHMVVYNHFAPVGQFGQVGLSFMGTTYIPSGKQPDWKHNHTSSALGIGEGEMNNLSMSSAQCNPPNMPAPVHGSPLLPMASPLAMFDASSFQSAPDMSVQACWSHVPPSPLHSVPVSMPLQQPKAGALPPQLSHGVPVGQSLATSRFSESRTSTPSDNGGSFPVATDATVSQFVDELGLVDSSSSSTGRVSAQGTVNQGSSGGAIVGAAKADAVQNGCNNNKKGQNAFKTQPSQKNLSTQHYKPSTSYNYQRGGMSQKNNSGGDWSHRRVGFHGRNQSLGAEKGFPSSKMKQVYVAKQTLRSTTTAGE